MEDLTSEKLGELTLFSLEKRQLQEDLTAACQHLQRDYQKDGGRISMVVHGTGCHTDKLHKLKQKRF